MISFLIGKNEYVATEPAEWIDSDTGQPIADGPRGKCYWRLNVKNMVKYEVLAVARALCLSQFGDTASHGEERCCQAGGTAGCCVECHIEDAEKAIAAYREATETKPTRKAKGEAA